MNVTLRASAGPTAPPAQASASRPRLLSVVVPVRNEAPNIRPLLTEIGAALAGLEYEIVYVDDGSTDATPSVLADEAAAGRLRWRRHSRSCGQSAALLTGVRAARGDWIATLDGDGQNDPADIPRLLGHALSAGRPYALIAGFRRRRCDTMVKRVSSRIGNAVRSRLLGDGVRDSGCGLKLIDRATFLGLPHFDHMHRFLPALVLREGGEIVSIPVAHRPRGHGRSNYGTLDRLWAGVVDLAGVLWLLHRWQQPQVDVPSQPDP